MSTENPRIPRNCIKHIVCMGVFLIEVTSDAQRSLRHPSPPRPKEGFQFAGLSGYKLSLCSISLHLSMPRMATRCHKNSILSLTNLFTQSFIQVFTNCFTSILFQAMGIQRLFQAMEIQRQINPASSQSKSQKDTQVGDYKTICNNLNNGYIQVMKRSI